MGASASSSGCGYLDAFRRWMLLRGLDRIDATIERQTTRTTLCIDVEEEQATRARYWMAVALQRPQAEGRMYTHTDMLRYRNLARALATHEVAIQGYIRDLDKFVAVRIANDKLRQMADGGNRSMAEIVQAQAKLNTNPIRNAMLAQKRDIRTAQQLTAQHEANKVAAEGDLAIRAATDEIHADMSAELEPIEEETSPDDLEMQLNQSASFASIQRKFAEAMMGTLPPAPTHAVALLLPPPPPPPRSTMPVPGARVKKQAGKQYNELADEEESKENKDKLLSL